MTLGAPSPGCKLGGNSMIGRAGKNQFWLLGVSTCTCKFCSWAGEISFSSIPANPQSTKIWRCLGNLCILRMSFKTMFRNNPRKFITRFNEKLWDSWENRESWQVCSSLVRPGSYLHFCGVKLNSTCKFNQNLTSESAAAFLQHARLALTSALSDTNATPIQMSNFYHVRNIPGRHTDIPEVWHLYSLITATLNCIEFDTA